MLHMRQTQRRVVLILCIDRITCERSESAREQRALYKQSSMPRREQSGYQKSDPGGDHYYVVFVFLYGSFLFSFCFALLTV